MGRYILPILAGVMLLFSSCAVVNNGQKEPAGVEYALLRDKGVVNQAVKGYWKSIGNGYILDATSDSVLLYSYTTNFCYKEKNDYLEGLLNIQARFSKRKDTLGIYLADFGEKTTQLQTKKDFVKIDALPPKHLTFSAMQQLKPPQLFKLFMETLQENYAFSVERNLDWEKIRSEYGKKISETSTQQELFQVIGEVVTLSKDHHTKIIDTKGQTLQYRGTPAAEIVGQAFNQQSVIKKLNDYFTLFFNTNYKNITDSLLQGKGKKIANGQIEWGSLNQNIGYIGIYAFSNFVPKGVSRKQEIDSLNRYLEQILTALKDKKAIIVDVAFNFGGYDATVLTIASFFADKTRLAYTSQVYNNGVFYDESKVYVHPSKSITYTKPVYLLISDISRSAAESFALTMQVLPNVKLVGTHTLGIQSGMLGKSIGDFYSTSSNQRLLSPEGKYYEVSGVKPDVELTLFAKENTFGGHKEAVRRIMEMIEKGKTGK